MFACRWPCLPLPSRGPQDASEAGGGRSTRARPGAPGGPGIGIQELPNLRSVIPGHAP
jgi:hypothetical protein